MCFFRFFYIYCIIIYFQSASMCIHVYALVCLAFALLRLFRIKFSKTVAFCFFKPIATLSQVCVNARFNSMEYFWMDAMVGCVRWIGFQCAILCSRVGALLFAILPEEERRRILNTQFWSSTTFDAQKINHKKMNLFRFFRGKNRNFLKHQEQDGTEFHFNYETNIW